MGKYTELVEETLNEGKTLASVLKKVFPKWDKQRIKTSIDKRGQTRGGDKAIERVTVSSKENADKIASMLDNAEVSEIKDRNDDTLYIVVHTK
jgi:hypothetical protein